MEVHLHRALDSYQREQLTDRLLDLDPAALIDLDHASGHLRIATLAHSEDLLTLLRDLEPGVTAADIEHIPSGCCGGCGG
jgi:hypothetical protein